MSETTQVLHAIPHRKAGAAQNLLRFVYEAIVYDDVSIR